MKSVKELTSDELKPGHRLLIECPLKGYPTTHTQMYLITERIGFAQYLVSLETGTAMTRPQLIEFWDKRGGTYSISKVKL